MSTARDVRKRHTREQLLAAARDLFDSRGYAATTVDDIAAEAGTTRATLYLHFSSKADMLEHLVADVDDLFHSLDESALPRVVESGDPVAMREWLGRKLDQWTDIRPQLAMVMESDSDPDIAAIVSGAHERVIACMRAGLDAAGRFEPSTRDVRCTLAFGALEYLSRRFIRAGGWGDLDRARALDGLTLTWARLLAEPGATRQ